MSENQHTPEPWYAKERGDEHGIGIYAEVKEYRDIRTLNLGNMNTWIGQSPANAARIVACVNGCAGIADPSAGRDALAVLVEIRGFGLTERTSALLAAALAKAEGR